MLLFDLFSDFARPFRNARPQIEDSENEAVGDTIFVPILCC